MVIAIPACPRCGAQRWRLVETLADNSQEWILEPDTGGWERVDRSRELIESNYFCQECDFDPLVDSEGDFDELWDELGHIDSAG